MYKTETNITVCSKREKKKKPLQHLLPKNGVGAFIENNSYHNFLLVLNMRNIFHFSVLRRLNTFLHRLC